MRVAFTGHRPEKTGGFDPSNPVRTKIRAALSILLTDMQSGGALTAMSGMALGFDQDAAQVCIELSIPFTAAVPFHGQEKVWPLQSRKHYEMLLNKAANVHVVCEGGYAAFKMQKRNIWMIENSDLLIACWNGSPGGTANAVHYAEKTNKPVHRLVFGVF